ncbi:helix-turn-helix domain-containing protein [Microbacterium jejuense]|uniref:Helix-turn-helix domain-containing protein n=1 Tax=Microbacterium jejuense TaxID=1263637 RepID=A0ABS7HPW7_9MICO|nr:helix-turn-helix domain-containing protein [Microbacterium jejuense]MBW9095001.1 helix-turn-helix domain-containing protein [Microbacterium jejuense]
MTVLVTNGTVFVDDGLREKAAEVVRRTREPGVRSLALVRDDDAAEELAPELQSLLLHVLTGLARGAVSVSSLPDELTTTVAAELIGVSRPTLMKMVRDGVLPARQVGSHTRLRTDDVLALRRARARERREALEALLRFDDEFGAD